MKWEGADCIKLEQDGASSSFKHCNEPLHRAFHNVLRDYKNLLVENRRTPIYETCTDIRNNSKIFLPVNCFSS